MRKTCKQGFTLIEILFVIAILSVLASLGISVLQQRAQQLKVERTALQMQQILQAGMAFKADAADQKWPDCGGSLSGQPMTANFDKYLPVNVLTNPWGTAQNTFCYPMEGGKKFRVLTTVPSVKIVDQIKALLPNAGIPDSQTIPPGVYTEVSGTMGGGTTTEKVVFKDVGSKDISHASFSQGTGDDSGKYISPKDITINCSSGMKGDLLFLTKQIYAGDDAVLGARNIKNLSYASNCDYSDDYTVASCGVTVTFQADEVDDDSWRSIKYPATSARIRDDGKGSGGVGSLSLQYITYCKRR